MCAILLRKTIKDYYRNLNEKDVERFWKTLKPFFFFSDTVESSGKITLGHEDSYIENAGNQRCWFSAECISHPVLKAIVKFRNHPIASAIRNALNPQSFNFSKVSVDDVLNEISNTEH